MKILVTGASGFAGKHLINLLHKHNHQVIALCLNNVQPLLDMGVSAYKADIIDDLAVKNCLLKEKPDGVIHLAAQSNVHASWTKPIQTATININGTLTMLESVAEVCPTAKFLNIGSGDEYGLAANCGKLLDEEMPCQPQNPYSISKLCAEQLVLQLGRELNLNVVHVRPFNHFGSGQQTGFVISDFASQIAAIEKGAQEPIIKVGDLSPYRDFTYVEDTVAAYTAIMENNIPNGVYNICTGKVRQIKEILELMLSLSSLKIKINVVDEHLRPSDVPFFAGSYAKLEKAVGWHPEHDFTDSLRRTLDYWRNK